MEKFDVVIIGAGSAGSVVARRLHDAGQNVALLEAGGPDTNPAIHEPNRVPELWHGEEDWDHHTVPQQHAADRRIHLPRGKVLGGSHSLNAMIFVRCHPADFDQWAELGNEGWAWKDVLPIYKAMENFEGGESELRGGEGLMDVVVTNPLNAIQSSIIDAAGEIGIERNDDYNGEKIEGIAPIQVTTRNRKRLSSFSAYVRPILDSPRMNVITHAWVHRLLFEGTKVVGIEYEKDGVIQTLNADSVVLSAGAIDSPRVLLRSGIGPADELRELGIPVVVDSPEVGRNLHDHLITPVIFTTDKAPVPPLIDGMGIIQTHLFWHSKPGLRVPDTQPVNFNVPVYDSWMTGPDNGFTLMGGIVTPKSRGSVKLGGPGAHDELLIDLNVFSDEDDDDLSAMAFSVRQCEQIGAAPALADKWGARQIYPEPGLDDEALIDYIRHAVTTYHHVAGSCRMGVDDRAVVDPQLVVRGVEGLRVADASIMPNITTGNTNAPSMLIGEQAARFMLASVPVPS